MSNEIKTESKTSRFSPRDTLKFMVCSIIGVYLFLVPVPYNDSFNLTIGIIIDLVKKVTGDYLLYAAVLLIVFSAAACIWVQLAKPKLVLENKTLKSLFVTTPFYLASRIVGAIFTVMVFFKVGPDFIISGATGGTMLDLSKTLVAILTVISYLMPLLTDFGVMEFTGVLIRRFVKPLFTCPGRSAIDLITSWLGASNAAVLLTKRQYDTGFYSAREAAVIMTNFSLVSVPFCYIIASMLKLESLFTAFYLSVTATGFILAIITPRIYPLNKVPDTYNPATGKLVNEELPEGKKRFEWALEQAAARAGNTTAKDVLHAGNQMFSSVLINLLPIIMSWGTIALIVVEHTKVFQYISYPLGFYLNLFGIEEAFKAAPATLVGFVDMFIPALILASVTAVKTKFIIGALSLVQIIYLTEVGAIIIQSDVPLDLKALFVIFLERTLLAIPLLALFASLVF